MAGGTTYYFGTINGNGSSGWVVTPDGTIDTMKSGPLKKGYLPEGEYQMVDLQETNEKSMHPAGTNKVGIKIRLAAKGVTKKDENGRPWIPDPRHPEGRTNILIHFDGPSGTGRDGDGTEGCAGFGTFSTKESLRSAYDNRDRSFVVKYFKTKEEAQRAAEAYKKKMLQQRADADPSKTNKGASVTEGEKTVLLGTEQRCAAHLSCPVDDGSVITEHSPSIYVGQNQYPMSGVDDATSNGSLVATGVPSIYMV
jgi:hypothetical protein